MDQSVSPAAPRSVDIFSQQIRRTPAQRQHAQQTDTQAAQRKYEIMYLDADHRFNEYTTIARAHPAFEDAFSALGHNAIVQTQNGHMSVEDVLPGDEVRLSDGQFETLLWRGRITISPPEEGSDNKVMLLTRVTSDALGYNRPNQDLVLGPAARLLHRASGIRKVTGSDAAFIPATDFIDGNTVLSLRPTSPVSVFQFGFAGQRSLSVNGVEVETLHPGTAFNLGLRGDALREYLSLFPHKRSFEEFGLMDYPRLRMRDLDLLG
ncbi:Hint domain-containing protein [Yoonia sp. F2084L]|uniref:Hint domain-containing protein n=1 Tax=Yoonia sp. F2084L TaxID=2926419 RepID=UPI001FF69FEB|nr:Hint domain-containing protein [Yoonia sp. F2084L]MCK0095630.1 Hint domain-containing protein [Yoonia sp. F2084L]